VPEGTRRLEAPYFDALYERSPDPWDFETSPYEQHKYARTLAALGRPERRFSRALEVGCSIGVLTERLAPRCDAILAVDLSALAVGRARARLTGWPNVTVERRRLPEQMPGGPFDLLLCSEVLYYWDAPLLRAAAPVLAGALSPGGSLVAVHWRPATRDYPLLGDEVHMILAEELDGLEHVTCEAESRYRLDRWDRAA